VDFKVGDKVKCIDNEASCERLELGGVYVVSRVLLDCLDVGVDFPEGWLKERFEKVEEPELSIGGMPRIENSLESYEAGELVDYRALISSMYNDVVSEYSTPDDFITSHMKHVEAHAEFRRANILEHLSLDEAVDPYKENQKYTIIEFKSLKELVEEFPELCFDDDGDMFLHRPTSKPLPDFLVSGHLHLLGTTERISGWGLESIPKQVIKRNLGF
jgi:hypothetical protein